MADIRSEFLAYLRELHGAFGPQSSLSLPGEYASILNEEDWGIGYGNPQDKNVQTFTSWIIRPDGSCRLATEATEDEIIHVSDVLGALVDMCRFQENRHAAMSRIKSAKSKILKRGTVRGTITAAAKKAASSGKKAAPMIEWTDSDNPYDPVRSRVFEGDRVACLVTKHGEAVYTVRAGKQTETASSLCLAKHIGEAMLEQPH